MRDYYYYDDILLALEEPEVEQFYEGPPRYIDPTTDFGFKRIFGTEANKDLLIAFLNELFRGRKVIKDLHYNKNEHVGAADTIGGVIFDLTCTASNGEQFVIEVQRAAQSNLKRRMLYYGSKIISEQAPKGRRHAWDYKISEVYVIVIMDGFQIPDGDTNTDYIQDIYLCNSKTGEIFYEDYGFIYIALVNFVKEEAELEGDFEGWLYVLKNMSKLDRLPLYLRKPIFERLFEIAEYSKMKKEDRAMYDVSLKRKWDEYSIQQTIITERERAVAEARFDTQKKERARAEAEVIKSAKKMLQAGLAVETIADFTSLTVEQIEALK